MKIGLLKISITHDITKPKKNLIKNNHDKTKINSCRLLTIAMMLKEVKSTDIPVVIGDFNAKIGKGYIRISIIKFDF